MFVELNLDEIVGPTHHFGGLGVGNVASLEHEGLPSSPRQAALECLRKARLVAELGVPQFVLPPLERPISRFLGDVGFEGTFQQQCLLARDQAPLAYSASFSSAFMWAANAATFAPSCDCRDGRHHLTVANLCSSWHRWPEAAGRLEQLGLMMRSLGSNAVRLHGPLPSILPMRDEGAANHMRLCDATGRLGFHVFVYGASTGTESPQRFLPRQTLPACQAIARLHQLDPSRTFFLQQHPEAIDAGVFHNDVIATSHRDLLWMHELAFYKSQPELDRLKRVFASVTGTPLRLMHVTERDLSLDEAVRSYLFNCQLLSPPAFSRSERDTVLLCAAECQRIPAAASVVSHLVSEPAFRIAAVHYLELNQSMWGGGGPACLRLRMTLPQSDLDAFAPNQRLTSDLADSLQTVIEQTYPQSLNWQTLSAPENLEQYDRAYAALRSLFGIRESRRE